jgi:hypothetical protein
MENEEELTLRIVKMYERRNVKTASLKIPMDDIEAFSRYWERPGVLSNMLSQHYAHIVAISSQRY